MQHPRCGGLHMRFTYAYHPQIATSEAAYQGGKILCYAAVAGTSQLTEVVCNDEMHEGILRTQVSIKRVSPVGFPELDASLAAAFSEADFLRFPRPSFCSSFCSILCCLSLSASICLCAFSSFFSVKHPKFNKRFYSAAAAHYTYKHP